MARTRDLLFGAALAIGAKSLLNRLLLEKFRADVRALNRGDYSGLLSSYADDAVLHFNEGGHRWSGEHQGREAIELFLRDFTGAGLQGEVLEMWSGGFPWKMTLAARFDDRATGPDGEEIYSNKTVIVLKTSWGKIVEQSDFYEDTTRVLDFEEKLTQLGIDPA